LAARSLITLERFEQAEPALRECVGLEPRLAEAHNSLAQLIWMRTGNIVEATRALDQALENTSMTMRCGPQRPPYCTGSG
jgi:Flp pilus assembly protein TadD